MQNIAIFGGSGMTGLCAVEAAVKKGLTVRALARDPSRFPENLREKIDIVQGDVLNLGDVEKAVKGVDGVVIVLGTRNDVRPTTMMSEGTKNVLTAMAKAGIKPVSVCLSAFLFRPLDQVPAVLRALTEDHVRMFDLLKESNRDWIAVCPPHIGGEESGQLEVKNGEAPASRVVSKYHLGAFLVDSLEKKEHYHQKVGLATV